MRGRLLGQPLGKGSCSSPSSRPTITRTTTRIRPERSPSRLPSAFHGEPSRKTRLLVDGLGRPDRARRDRLAPARRDRAPERGGVQGGAAGRLGGAPLLRLRPGGNFGVNATLSRRTIASLRCSRLKAATFTRSMAFARTTFFSARLDLLLPLRGAFGFGGSAEYFNRHTFYQDATRTVLGYHYPQLRGYLPGSQRTSPRTPPPTVAPPPAPETRPTSAPSDVWFTAGGTFSTLRGDCQTCETDTRTGTTVAAADVGYRVNHRMDVGPRCSGCRWTPPTATSG